MGLPQGYLLILYIFFQLFCHGYLPFINIGLTPSLFYYKIYCDLSFCSPVCGCMFNPEVSTLTISMAERSGSKWTYFFVASLLSGWKALRNVLQYLQQVYVTLMQKYRSVIVWLLIDYCYYYYGQFTHSFVHRIRWDLFSSPTIFICGYSAPISSNSLLTLPAVPWGYHQYPTKKTSHLPVK